MTESFLLLLGALGVLPSSLPADVIILYPPTVSSSKLKIYFRCLLPCADTFARPLQDKVTPQSSILFRFLRVLQIPKMPALKALAVITYRQRFGVRQCGRNPGNEITKSATD